MIKPGRVPVPASAERAADLATAAQRVLAKRGVTVDDVRTLTSCAVEALKLDSRATAYDVADMICEAMDEAARGAAVQS